MSVLILFGILAFFVSPFALAGFERAWRGAAAVLLLLALYAACVWSQPIPAFYDEQDQLGAGAWRGIVSVILVGGSFAFAAGFALSALLRRYSRNVADKNP